MTTEESIECPFCDGRGYTDEHNNQSVNHDGHHDCHQCPIQEPCGYCFVSGRVTTKLMKDHINEQKRQMAIDRKEDDLPF